MQGWETERYFTEPIGRFGDRYELTHLGERARQQFRCILKVPSIYRCNKRFYGFLFRSRLFTFFNVFFYFFPRFLFKKTSKAKYECAKIQRETLSEDASATIFIDFGLLPSPSVFENTFFYVFFKIQKRDFLRF